MFSSTAAVYGEPDNVQIMEDDKTKSTNVYGEAKLAMENMIRWTADAHNLKYVALRYFNACGAHVSGEIGEAHDPESHLIPLVLQVTNGKRDKIYIFGDDYPTEDGPRIRDNRKSTCSYRTSYPGRSEIQKGWRSGSTDSIK